MLKSDSCLPKKLALFASMKTLKKWWKKRFIFTSKPLFVLTIFNFFPDFFSHVGNGMIRKLRLISIIMMWSTAKQIISIHLLPNISRPKGNQTLKFGQLKYNMRNIFLQKLCWKWGRETISRSIFFFFKVLYEVKAMVSTLVSIYISW